MIHKFVFDGTRIVLDVHSGALHRVDQVTWDLLEDYGKIPVDHLVDRHSRNHPRREVEEALAEIEQLVEQGMLFSPDPLNGSYTPPGGSVVKALCLHLAHDCNLSCRYCFAGQGKFGGAPGLMSLDVGKAALDFLIRSAGNRRHVEVDFFGGEPLLNKSVMYSLVEYGIKRGEEAGKEIKFTLTTNAVLLDQEAGKFLNKHNMSVVLSLDGRPRVHDTMRPFPGGDGSHDTVVRNILSFLGSRDYQNYVVRGTYTGANLDFAGDVKYMAGLGLKEISVEPVVAAPEEDYALREEHLPLLMSEYEELARYVLDRAKSGEPISFFHFNIELDGGPCLPKRLSGCGAGNEYLAVDPGGSLYPCHQFVGQPDYLMGDVYGGVTRRDLCGLFAGAHIYNKEGCPGCWAKFYCSGGCHASARAQSGSIFRPGILSCALMKKRIECALYLKVITSELNLDLKSSFIYNQ